jgi:dihydrofolate synthase/folylpolyglutamate synthase
LGDSRELIAIEKAGVARPAQPCVIADADPPSSLLSTLDALGAQSCLINREWRIGGGEMQTADHQRYRLTDTTGLLPVNMGAAIQALELSGLVTVDQSLVDQLASVILTGRLSRLQMPSFELVLDVAHNVESVSELVQFLRDHPVSGKTVAVFGVMGDKPIRDMLSACETAFDEWNLIDLRHVPRAMSTDLLAEFLEPMCTAINQGLFPDLWQSLLARVTIGDRVVVFGSFFSVGEVTAYLAAHRDDGEQN